jgi:hypothetical protein
MSETTTTTARAANKAGQKVLDAVASAGETALPTAVEVAEVTMSLDVPTKVVLNQKLIVVVSVAGGAALGAVGLWGAKKLRAVKARRDLEKALESEIVPNAS